MNTESDENIAIQEFLKREKACLGDLLLEIEKTSIAAAASATQHVPEICTYQALKNLPVKTEISDQNCTATTSTACVSCEKVRQWQEAQEKRLAQMEREEERKKLEWRLQAQTDITHYMQLLNESIAKSKISRHKLKATYDFHANPWQRVVDFCELNTKSKTLKKDVSRLRALYISLKEDFDKRDYQQLKTEDK